MGRVDPLLGGLSAIRTGARLRLMGDFALTLGDPIPLPHAAQRLIAYLAIARGPVSRERVAGALWGEASQHRAEGNLRSSLWRLGQLGVGIVERRGDALALASFVSVDVHRLFAIATGVLRHHEELQAGAVSTLESADELLPAWDEPWLSPERESLRQLRLHALEVAAERSLVAGDPAQAISLGLAAVETEPYRESAYRLLVKAHLDEGNASEAARQYLAYRRLATQELGVEPSSRMEELVDGIRPALRELVVDRPGRGRSI